MNPGYNAATAQSDDWRTPRWLFQALDAEFAFDCDAAADAGNALCPAFIERVENYPLHLDPPGGSRFFCNPSYSNIEPFIRRALRGSALWVFILPVRTRAAWFEMLRDGERAGRVEFRWLRRRVAFEPPPGVTPSSPRMDVFIAVVRAEGVAATVRPSPTSVS